MSVRKEERVGPWKLDGQHDHDKCSAHSQQPDLSGPEWQIPSDVQEKLDSMLKKLQEERASIKKIKQQQPAKKKKK